MKSEKEILSYLTQLNFLLSLLIIFHHGFTLPVDFNGSFSVGSYGYAIAIERYMYNLSECAVPTFFFISSYLFYRSFDGTFLQYVKKIKRRFWSLLVPYIIFCIMGYCKTKAFSNHEIGGGICGLLESIWRSNTMPLWFIRELIFFSLLAPVIYQIKRSLLAVIIVSLFSIIMGSMGIAKYQSFVYWLPVYLMGAAMNKEIFTKLINSYAHNYVKSISILSVVLYLIWVWYLPNGMNDADTSLRFEYIVFRILTPIIMCFVLWLIITTNLQDRRWMHYSFFVYCLHAPVIALLKLIYDKLFGRFIDVELFKYLFITSATYICCVFIALILERYTPKFWGILNGKR